MKTVCYRTEAQAGESRTVTFALPVNALSFYGRHMHPIVEPGTIEVMLGTSSADIHLTGSIEIVGDVVDVRQNEAFFSDAQIT